MRFPRQDRFAPRTLDLRRRLLLPVTVLAVLAGGLLSCQGGGSSPSAPPPAETCAGYAAWQSSPYVLPYPVGTAYYLDQGNCSGFSHSGFWRYSYDFLMPIGTLVTASEGGTVVEAIESAHDGDRTATNLITIQHADGTVMLYSHLTFEGALVDVGDVVSRGQAIALSGDTGASAQPHLHLSLHSCPGLPGLPGGRRSYCPSLPLTFRNTDPNPQGLVAGRTYTAGPF